tara:strand:- start:566 stop:832 length:267 start_codon:yes stop_codon:yes gene_type:complete
MFDDFRPRWDSFILPETRPIATPKKNKIPGFLTFFSIKIRQISLDFRQKTGALAANVKIWLNINFSLDKKNRKNPRISLAIDPTSVKI